MRRLLVLATIGPWSWLSTVTPSEANACDSSTITATSGQSTFNAGAQARTCQESTVEQAAGTSELPPGRWESSTVCVLGGDQTCSDQLATCENGVPLEMIWYQTASGERLGEHTSCPTEEQPEEEPQPTETDFYNAFASIPLPKSVLHVQPADGRTLVNFATNFFTVQPAFTASADVLGTPVEFSIRASSFTWHYGDGTSATTTSPGAAYPDLQVTHAYATEGNVEARVDTTYSADWRIGDGPWTPVTGTVTITGDPVTLTVLTATPQLVG